ncbi:MAG TPA: class II fructose-bisphosphate aldolase [Spirochaetia bacterium]|nr:class II fructose-bisphosphate aldolase [Spirochaetia bacterium]
MGTVSFARLMEDACSRGYAVGYFESWNMESLLAVADAAEAARSPVILGFSGISIPNAARRRAEHLADYYALASTVSARLSVPSCLLFNECPDMGWIAQAVQLGFHLVMFSDEGIEPDRLVEQTRRAAELAHAASAAAEGEPDSLPGIGGDLVAAPSQRTMTDPQGARRFVKDTGVDALAVNVGQAHLHGREKVRLDLERLSAISAAADVPLVLHGATSLSREDLRESVRRGVRKVNVGSVLKRTFFETLRGAGGRAGDAYNPYEVLGSGLTADVLEAAREALQDVVEDYMGILGSAGKA